MTQPVPIAENQFEIRTIGGRKALYYKGKECYLAGIYPPVASLDGKNANGQFAEGDFNSILDKYASSKNNFFRFWVTAYFLQANPPHVTSQDPRARYSPFFLTAQGKYDLARYNQNYFDRLVALVSQAEQRGIVVQLTIFDRCGLDSVGSDSAFRWPMSPWNSTKNINGLIADPTKGVSKFYNRAIVGTNGVTLGQLQDAYVKKVVESTRGFANVVYEIMNEPTEGDPANPDRNPMIRATWANKITELINSLTDGKRLVFYNDHSGNLNDVTTRGKDVIYWKANKSVLTSYDKCHGVIFHGNPRIIDAYKPDGTAQYSFSADKLFEVSTDAFGNSNANGELREQEEWNQQTTNTAFARHQLYQAEAGSVPAAKGIAEAVPNPTILLLAPFLFYWRKTSVGGPQFYLLFEPNGRYLAVDPLTNNAIEQGIVDRVTKESFFVISDGQTNTREFRYSFSADGLQLTYSNTNTPPFTQTFKRLGGSYDQFVSHWQKTSTAGPQFALLFQPSGRYDGVDLNTDQPIDRGYVDSVTNQQFVTLRDGETALRTFQYSFSADKQMLTYTSLSNNFTQTFKRFTGPIAPFLYNWEKVAESSPTNFPNIFLHFRQNNTFAVRNADAEHTIRDYGSVKQISTSPRQIVFHFDSRPVEATWNYEFLNGGRTLRLTKTDGSYWEDFARRI